MTGRIGLWGGLALFVGMLLLPAPEAMPLPAWRATAVVALMAVWWMTQALPLTATALVPFLAFPMMGIMSANEAAAAYYSPILFLVLGGAMVALAIERTGLHRRLALAIVARGGGTPAALLLAFMIATATLSLIVSNTATTLIMIPIAVAVLKAAQVPDGDTSGFAGALVMGIAFAASIGGLGTLVGSPTNAIAAGIVERSTGLRIDFLTWALYGIPVVLIAIRFAGSSCSRSSRSARVISMRQRQAPALERLDLEHCGKAAGAAGCRSGGRMDPDAACLALSCPMMR
jgi:sodium-dependent dicarboxylate transporter 2/3/5